MAYRNDNSNGSRKPGGIGDFPANFSYGSPMGFPMAGEAMGFPMAAAPPAARETKGKRKALPKSFSSIGTLPPQESESFQNRMDKYETLYRSL